MSHALFSDASAAVVLIPGDSERGYAVREVAAVTDTTTADHMTWEVTDLGFRMGLSPQVPQVLSLHVRKLVDDLLGRHGLTDRRRGRLGGASRRPEDPGRGRGAAGTAAGCAVGVPGRAGRVRQLLLTDRPARAGRAPPAPDPPRRVVMLAFGPGLTLYVTLLEGPTLAA